jgi:hypothetical protein
MLIGLLLKFPLFLSDFNETWIFWADFRKKYSKEYSQWVSLFHADRQTDMTKLIVAFRNFANAPKTACMLILCMLKVIHREIIHTAFKLIVCMLTVVRREIKAVCMLTVRHRVI